MSDRYSFQFDSLINHPIDIVEEIVNANEWNFERFNDDQVYIEIQGHWCCYDLVFLWEQDFNALYFSCQLDIKINKDDRTINELLTLINNRLWVGSFGFCPKEEKPIYRYTILLRGINTASVEQVEDIIDIAMTESERYFPAFQLVFRDGVEPQEALAVTLMEPEGCA